MAEYLRLKRESEGGQDGLDQIWEVEELDQNISKIAVFSDLYWMTIGILSLDMKDPGIDMMEYVRQRYCLVRSKLK